MQCGSNLSRSLCVPQGLAIEYSMSCETLAFKLYALFFVDNKYDFLEVFVLIVGQGKRSLLGVAI